MVVLVMGVSGSGKTTIGKNLATRMKCEFADADDYHPQANVEKMRSGIPLDDADRLPWLDALGQLIIAHLADGRDLVLACSALKDSYRKRLMTDDARVKLVYLKGDYKLIASRLAARENHYMNPRLLESQFATLEEPADAITINIAAKPEEITAQLVDLLKRSL